RELNHAPRALGNPFRRGIQPQIILLSSVLKERPNARITRRPEPTPKHEKVRIGGRVHAAVRPPQRGGMNLPRTSPPPSGALTPGITRRPASLISMRIVVSAVGCMPLLCAAHFFRKSRSLHARWCNKFYARGPN
ncbi:MAG: hypothetical protein M3362_20425, partial [Acidobacteriota bacterium]|nr:hypothetical protein [Acidobacteriota bacterium]